MKNPLRFLPFVGATLLLSNLPAADKEWTGYNPSTGVTYPYWGDPEGWVQGTAPVNSLTADRAVYKRFDGAFQALERTQSVRGLYFGQDAGQFILFGVALDDSLVTLTLGSAGIVNDSAADQYIGGDELALHLGTSSTFSVTGGGDLNVTSKHVYLDSHALTLHSAGTGGVGSMSAPVIGTGGLTKTGPGKWTLSGANTYTGNTTVSSGTLVLSNTTQSSAFAIGSGGVLELEVASGNSRDKNSGTTTFSGGGTLRKTGGGDISWTGGSAVFALNSGSMIDIQGGNFLGGSFGNENWSANLSDLNVAAGANFNGVEANVRVDALTGGGTIRSGYNAAGYQNFLFGVDNGSGTFSGVLANQDGYAGHYVKVGTGTQILTGANSFTGSMSISGGTLQLGNGGSSGSVATDIVNNAALVFNRSDAFSYGGVVSGSGSLTKQGAGTLMLTGTNTYAGGTTISGGTLQLGNGGATGSVAGNIAVANGAALAFARSGFTLYGGVISGAGTVIKNGTNALLLTGANTHTGATTVNAGTLVLDNTTQSSAFTIAAGAILELSVASGSRDRTTGTTTFSGNGTLKKTGAGELLWSTGSAVFALSPSGMIDVQGGSFVGGNFGNETWTDNFSDLNVAAGASFHGVEANVRVDALTGAGQIASGFNGSGYAHFTFGVANGSGDFAGTLANGVATGNYLKVGTGTQILSGTNTFTGTMTVSGGTLQLGNGGATGSVAGNIANNATLIFNRNNPVSYGGVISGSGAVTKNGTNTLTLSGANTYAGTTTVNAGMLVLNNTTQSSGFAIGSGAVLELAVASGSRDRTTGTTTFSGTGTLKKTGAGEIKWSTGAATFALGSGSLIDVQAGTFVGGNSGNENWTNNSANLTVAAGAVFMGGEANVRVNALNGAGLITSGPAGLGYQNFTFGVANGSGNFAGVLGDHADGMVGNYVKAGTGSQILSGTNTFTGTMTVTGGQLMLGNGGAAGSVAGNIVLDNVNTSVGFHRSNAVTYGGVISGAGSVSKDGTNTLTLTGENTHTRTTLVYGGTLQIGDGGATGSVASGIELNSGTALVFNRSNNFTHGGLISGAGSVTKTGAGTLTLTGTSTYTGATVLNEGTLAVATIGDAGVAGNLGAAKAANLAADLVFNGGTLSYTGATASTNRNFTINADKTATIQVVTAATNLTLAGASAATNGGLTKTGAGTLTLAGANAYTGATVLSEGTLAVATIGNAGVAGNLGAAKAANLAADLVFNGGTLSYTGATASTNRNFTINADKTARIEVTAGATNLTLSGASVATNGALTKTGAGTLILTGNNLHTGITRVAAGTLQIGNRGSSGSVAGNFAIAIGGELSFTRIDVSSYGGVISGTGSVTADLSQVTKGSKVSTGVLTLTGTNTYTGVTTLESGTLAVATIGNAGVASNLGAAKDSNLAADLVFDGGLLSYTGATASTNRNFTINADKTARIEVTAGATNLTLSGASVATNGALTKTGAGTLVLTGNNLHTGLTTVTAGTLQLSNGGGVGGDLAVNAAAALVFNRNGAATYGGVISGGGSVTHSGFVGGTPGLDVLTLIAANTYTGATVLREGVLAVSTIGNAGVASNLGAAKASNLAADLVFDGGTLRYRGATATTNRNFTINEDKTATIEVGPTAINLTLSGASVATNGGLTKTGPGTLVLAGNNLHTGLTTVSSGTLQLGNGGNSGSVAGDIATNAALVFNRANTLTYGGVISGTGSVTKTGAGLLTLTGLNTYTDATRLSGGVLAVATIGNAGVASNLGAAKAGNLAADLVFDGGALRYTGDTAASNRNFTINGDKTATIEVMAAATQLTLSGASALTGGALTKSGLGTLTLTGANRHTGLTTVSAGLLQLGDGGNSGSVAGDIANGAALVFNRANTLTYGGVISGTGTVTNLGAGLLTLTGLNTYTGATRLSGGVLAVATIGNAGVASNLGAAKAGNLASDLVFDGGTLRYTGLSAATDRNFTINAAKVATIDVATSHLILTGASAATTGALTKTGDGALTLTGANLHTGATTVAAGILQLGNGGATGGVAGDIANEAALFFNRSDDTTYRGVISGAGTVTKTGANTLTLTGAQTYTGVTVIADGLLQIGSGGTTGSLGGDIANSAALAFNRRDSLTYGGAISGTGTVTKEGAGALDLTGANTYTGTTNVNAGTLLVNGSLGDTQVTVNSGATLGGTGTIGGLVSMLADSHLAAGNSPGMLTFTNGLAFDSGAIIDFELGTTSDLLRITGGLLSGPAGLGGIKLNLLDIGGFNPFVGGSFTLFDYAGATLNGFDVGDFTFGSLLAGTSRSNYSFAFSDSKLLLAISGTGSSGNPGSSVPDSGSSLALFAAALLGLAAGRRRVRL